MIVSASIEEDGAILVTVDSDGDQGHTYSTDVLDDMAQRAARTAVRMWAEVHGEKKAAATARKPRTPRKGSTDD